MEARLYQKNKKEMPYVNVKVERKQRIAVVQKQSILLSHSLKWFPDEEGNEQILIEDISCNYFFKIL